MKYLNIYGNRDILNIYTKAKDFFLPKKKNFRNDQNTKTNILLESKAISVQVNLDSRFDPAGPDPQGFLQTLNGVCDCNSRLLNLR